MRFAVGCQICHILVAQVIGNTTHGRVLAIAFFVGTEGRNNVLGTLTRDLGHFVNLRKAGLIALDAVAADAHRYLFLASLRVTFDLLGINWEGRHTSDKQD